MFLNPQHFQAQDQYLEDTLQFRFSVSSYANWGVAALSIDEEALANGLFRLNGARGIMPDGLAFRMPDTDELPASREFGEYFPPTSKEIEVYLAIPEFRLDAANVTMPAASPNGRADTRFVATSQMTSDLNSGIEQKEIQVARKNFRLIFGSENRNGFGALRIARIVRSTAGIYQLKPTHIAPCLDIAHNKYLTGLLQTLVGILSNKSSSLSVSRRERGKSLADFTASETTNFWLLHTVNSSLPELRHIWKVRHGHPENVYLALTRLAGGLATFALDFVPDDLPDYDHKDLESCFVLLEKQIRLLIDTVIVEPFITIPLALGDRNIWTGSIMDDRYFEDAQFFLSISSANETGELIQKVPVRVRVAAVDQIDRLIEKALGGIGLYHTPAPPAIRMKIGNQYFSLGQSGEQWQQIKKARNIAVYTPSDIREPKLELIIVKSKRD